jgi:hypothetical protein
LSYFSSVLLYNSLAILRNTTTEIWQPFWRNNEWFIQYLCRLARNWLCTWIYEVLPAATSFQKYHHVIICLSISSHNNYTHYHFEYNYWQPHNCRDMPHLTTPSPPKKHTHTHTQHQGLEHQDFVTVPSFYAPPSKDEYVLFFLFRSPPPPLQTDKFIKRKLIRCEHIVHSWKLR